MIVVSAHMGVQVIPAGSILLPATQANRSPQQFVDTCLPALPASTKGCNHILVEPQCNKRLTLTARPATAANSFDNMRNRIRAGLAVRSSAAVSGASDLAGP